MLKSGSVASELLVPAWESSPVVGSRTLDCFVVRELPKNMTYPIVATSPTTAAVAIIRPGVQNLESDKDFSLTIVQHRENISRLHVYSPSSSGESFTSVTGSEIWYSSPDQFPRSISRHRSEQNGRSGLSFQVVGLSHIGHFILNHQPSRQQ